MNLLVFARFAAVCIIIQTDLTWYQWRAHVRGGGEAVSIVLSILFVCSSVCLFAYVSAYLIVSNSLCRFVFLSLFYEQYFLVAGLFDQFKKGKNTPCSFGTFQNYYQQQKVMCGGGEKRPHMCIWSVQIWVKALMTLSLSLKFWLPLKKILYRHLPDKLTYFSLMPLPHKT